MVFGDFIIRLFRRNESELTQGIEVTTVREAGGADLQGGLFCDIRIGRQEEHEGSQR